MTNEQRAEHFRRCYNAHAGEKDIHQNPSIARLIPRTQHAPNGTPAHRAHQEQNFIPCTWNHGELGSQWDLTQICIRLWSTCLHAADLPVEILNHELCSNGSLFHWVDRMKTDFTRTIVTLACSCAMGPIGSPGSNGSHLAVFKPIKRQNNYSGGCLEVVQGIPADMMWGFIVPILQNAVENADPHQAFDGRSWKTTLESTPVQAAFKACQTASKRVCGPRLGWKRSAAQKMDSTPTTGEFASCAVRDFSLNLPWCSGKFVPKPLIPLTSLS